MLALFIQLLSPSYKHLGFLLLDLLLDPADVNLPNTLGPSSLCVVVHSTSRTIPATTLRTHTFATTRNVKMSAAPVSHGRGGQGNVYPDDTKYTDGEVVREGETGTGVSTGRGGT
ncbi:hypothetical protein FJTKL_08157 [Diaporthe vaccinii]|uniref:Uncharacterized protein n=1 Tax=Diaporthe vaccinii TaxID=105482 RepID=A0ABR4EST8_9PEZI